jgi:hypothetical protein
MLTIKFWSDGGLYYCAGTLDWGRASVEGFNLSCNILFHETLRRMAPLALLRGPPDLATHWSEIASTLKPNLEKFWDSVAGLYTDNLNAPDLHPQDGNSLACWFDIADGERAEIITTNLKKRWGPFGPINPECSGPVSPFISGFELQALVHANKMNDALQMIRTAWGWMINNPAITGSTMLEAWGGNGEITYPLYAEKPSYISHCHPFSTGPALVLTFEVLGLNFTDAGGRCWDFKPSPGDLEHCEGGFTGAYGKYSAGWKKIRENGRITFSCWVQAPEGTIGRVRMPVITNGWPNAIVEEKSLKNETENGYRWLNGVVGGERHKFIV